MRAAQLRDYAIRYIGQFEHTMSQAEAGRLARELLDAIEGARERVAAAV